MNYLLVISHKKHIIQTAQDIALLNPITDYNHSPELQREGNKSVGKGWKEIISPHSGVTLSVSSVYPCCLCLYLSTALYLHLPFV